jgi:hypothetical protein
VAIDATAHPDAAESSRISGLRSVTERWWQTQQLPTSVSVALLRVDSAGPFAQTRCSAHWGASGPRQGNQFPPSGSIALEPSSGLK